MSPKNQVLFGILSINFEHNCLFQFFYMLSSQLWRTWIIFDHATYLLVFTQFLACSDRWSEAQIYLFHMYTVRNWQLLTKRDLNLAVTKERGEELGCLLLVGSCKQRARWETEIRISAPVGAKIVIVQLLPKTPPKRHQPSGQSACISWLIH